MRMHTLIGLASIAAGKKMLNEQRYFLRFFERSSETNLLWLAKQINTAIREDTELTKYLGSPSRIQGDECVESQYHRLDHAITECKKDLTALGVLAFPFMGLALDKLNNNDPKQNLQKFQN